jgi:MFS family permease
MHGWRKLTDCLGLRRNTALLLVALVLAGVLIRFCERLPYAFVILWVMNHGGLSAQEFGVLTAIEMATAMLCYIPVARLADKHGQRPFVLATFLFFTLFPVSLLWADNFAWLAVAFVVRGLKEFGEPARKALIIAQGPPELRSRTFGAYYLIRDGVVTSGSFLGAWLWNINPRANFIGAALIGLGGTLYFWWFIYRTRPADDRRVTEHEVQTQRCSFPANMK